MTDWREFFYNTGIQFTITNAIYYSFFVVFDWPLTSKLKENEITKRMLYQEYVKMAFCYAFAYMLAFVAARVLGWIK